MSTLPIALVPQGNLKPRREQLWLDEGKVCHWCQRPTRLVDGDAWDQATIDHIIPRYKGGTNDPENLTSACRLCNNRRSHEDAKGLPDGSLLGKYKVHSVKRKKYIVLSGDEKKALMAKMDKGRHISNEDVLREQRDQGLKQIAILQKELSDCKTALNKLQSMSIATLIRMRLAKWLLREKDKNGNNSQSN